MDTTTPTATNTPPRTKDDVARELRSARDGFYKALIALGDCAETMYIPHILEHDCAGDAAALSLVEASYRNAMALHSSLLRLVNFFGERLDPLELEYRNVVIAEKSEKSEKEEGTTSDGTL